MPRQAGNASASVANPTHSLANTTVVRGKADIPVPPANDAEPPSVYPMRRHFFHLDVIELLDAFLLRNSTELAVFKQEFKQRDFSFICEMHCKEVPQDVMTLLADVIYNIAQNSRYSLGCVYLLYLVYYSQEPSSRYPMFICRTDLRLLNDIVSDLNPSHSIVGRIFNKMVTDNAFMVSIKKCPVTTYYSGSGYYYRILKAGVQPQALKTKSCKTDGSVLSKQDGEPIIDFEEVGTRVAAQSGSRKEIFQSMLSRFEVYKKYRRPDKFSVDVFAASKKKEHPLRMKKREASVAMSNSDRLGIRDALAMIGAQEAELDLSAITKVMKRQRPLPLPAPDQADGSKQCAKSVDPPPVKRRKNGSCEKPSSSNCSQGAAKKTRRK